MPDRVDIPDELFSAAVDNALSPAEQQRVEAALESDPIARRKVESFGRVKRLVRSAMAPRQPEPDFHALMTRALDAVDAERHAAPGPRWRPISPARLWRLAPAVVAGVALFGLTVLLLPPGTVRLQATDDRLLRPNEGDWELQPAQLATAHARWSDHFRMWPQPAEQLRNIAPRLSEEVGYPVLGPDLKALDATVFGAIADTGIGGKQRMTALFVLRRRDGAELSLFEIAAPPHAVRAVGFRRTRGGTVRVAEVGGTVLALHSADWIHVCLASNDVPLEALMTLAPRAVRWDLAQPRPAAEPLSPTAFEVVPARSP